MGNFIPQGSNRKLRRRVKFLKKGMPTKTAVSRYLIDSLELSPVWVKWLFDKKTKKVSLWSSSEVIEALVLRKKTGTRAYEHIRKRLMMPLPSVATLRRRIEHFQVDKGVINGSLDILRRHLQNETRPGRKVAVLSFDEISVTQDITYDQRMDQILPSASKMQVCFVRGLVRNFRIPIFADFDTPVTSELLTELITKVEEAGARVIAEVNDMAPDNVGLWKSMGVTPERPWFVHPLDPSRKVFCLADPPHLIKLSREAIQMQKKMI